jgi:hypothetical protein
LGQLLKIRLETISGARDWMAVMIGDLHAEPFRPARYGTAHLAKPEDTQPLAAHLSSERQVFVQPTTRAHKSVGYADPSRRRQHQPQRQVGDILGQDIGGRRNPNRARAGALQIDRVSADAVDGDDFQPRQRIDNLIADAMPAAGNDGAHRGAYCGDQRRAVACCKQAVHTVGGIEPCFHLGHHRFDQQHVRFHVGPPLGRCVVSGGQPLQDDGSARSEKINLVSPERLLLHSRRLLAVEHDDLTLVLSDWSADTFLRPSSVCRVWLLLRRRSRIQLAVTLLDPTGTDMALHCMPITFGRSFGHAK